MLHQRQAEEERNNFDYSDNEDLGCLDDEVEPDDTKRCKSEDPTDYEPHSPEHVSKTITC